MQPRYDWHKGQDAWEESEAFGPVQEERLPGSPLPDWWHFGLAVILIISLIGVSVYWILDQRASENTAAVEDDILAANALIYQAMVTGDGELLRSNMSGREPGWAAGIESAVSAGMYYDRSLWGLQFQPSLKEENPIDINLNPEWNTAELSIPLNYTYENTAGLTQTIRLEQTLVYRRSLQKWLLAPPNADFWGQRLLFEGQYLTLNYPARDMEFVSRLGPDLDEQIRQVCEMVEDLSCSADFRIGIRFDTESLSTPDMYNPSPCLNLERGFPTPSLIGIPIDDAGYEALYEGYRSELLTVTVGQLIDFEQCPASPLMTAIIDYRLAEMGLQPWPMEPEDYRKLFADQVHLRQMYYFVQGQVSYPAVVEPATRDWRPYYGLIEFLREAYQTPFRTLEKDIDQNRLDINRYWSTLHNWTDLNFAANKPLELDWQNFILRKSGQSQDESPTLPDQNLRLACYGGDITTGIAYPTGVLYELDLETGEMTAVYPLNHTDGYLVSLPGDEGVIVAEQRLDFVQENARVLLWGDEAPVVLFETAENLVPVSVVANEGLLVYSKPEAGYGVIWWNNCLEGFSCGRSAFSGFPLWSPTYDRFLSLNGVGNYGYEGQLSGPFGIRLSTPFSNTLAGSSPFWLSDERFGYIEEDGRTIMVSTITAENSLEQPEILFTLEEVDPLLALDLVTKIKSVVSNPREPEDLIVTVVDRAGWASIYQVNILRRWIQRLQQRSFFLGPGKADSTTYSFDFSPQGRWLTITGYDLSNSTAHLHFYDLAENKVHSFDYKDVFERPLHWTMDWSAGDEWLALPDNGYIRLINPAADFQDVIVPDGVTCSGAVWVND